MNAWELSNEIERFFDERRKSLSGKTGAKSGALFEMLLQNFDEASVRAIAVDYGALPENAEALSFGSVTRELVNHILRTGQWEALRRRFEKERPFVLWADAVSPFSVFLPLTQKELVHYPKYFQAALLLAHHFSIPELNKMISRLDQTIDWLHPPYSYRRPQLTAVIFYYLAGVEKIPQLLTLMKELRSQIPIIQQFSWEELETPFPRKSPDELFLEVKAAPVQQTASIFAVLEEQLLENFSRFELEQMCFDAGIQDDWFSSRTIQEQVNNIVKFLGRISGGLTGRGFIAGCIEKVPSFEWAAAAGLDKAAIPPLNIVAIDGFYLYRLRNLLERCLPDNNDIFDFVERLFPYMQFEMSIKWPPGKNRVKLIEGLKRRGRMSELLTALEKAYPQQYSLFAPYAE